MFSFCLVRVVGKRSKGKAKIMRGIVKTIIPNHQAPINRGSEGAKGESEIRKGIVKTIIPNHQAPINRGSVGAKGESEIIRKLVKTTVSVNNYI